MSKGFAKRDRNKFLLIIQNCSKHYIYTQQPRGRKIERKIRKIKNKK